MMFVSRMAQSARQRALKKCSGSIKLTAEFELKRGSLS